MKFENFLKGPISSTIGIVMMVASVYVVLFMDIEVWKAVVVFVGGFMMLYMRDAIPGFITRLLNKKIKE